MLGGSALRAVVGRDHDHCCVNVQNSMSCTSCVCGRYKLHSFVNFPGNKYPGSFCGKFPELKAASMYKICSMSCTSCCVDVTYYILSEIFREISTLVVFAEYFLNEKEKTYAGSHLVPLLAIYLSTFVR